MTSRCYKGTPAHGNQGAKACRGRVFKKIVDSCMSIVLDARLFFPKIAHDIWEMSCSAYQKFAVVSVQALLRACYMTFPESHHTAAFCFRQKQATWRTAGLAQ